MQQQVRAELINQKRSDLSLTTGAQALASLKSGKSLDELAQEWDGLINDHGFVTRDQAEVVPAILGRGFSMPKPDKGLVYDGLTLNDGEYVVIELAAVMSNNAEPEQGSLENLLQAKGGVEYRSALNYLGTRAEVVKT